jgi:hypothetical protein
MYVIMQMGCWASLNIEKNFGIRGTHTTYGILYDIL